jgi:hypothetical protein
MSMTESVEQQEAMESDGETIDEANIKREEMRELFGGMREMMDWHFN